jgi:serine/threonine-protein kinase
VALTRPLTPGGEPQRLFKDLAAQVSDAEISPNGRWIAYESNESGRFEVSVRPYPAIDDGRWQVSSNGGMHPLWSRDGQELFFMASDGMMMSTRIQAGTTFAHARPVALFPAGQYHVNVARNYDVAPDGKRFLMIKWARSEKPRPPMVIVTHWFDEVRAKMAAK